MPKHQVSHRCFDIVTIFLNYLAHVRDKVDTASGF